ncbi:MAG TPA: hypothetical protein VNK52_04475 [Hyphomicrobiaceae bacterium]|nr:hypothetical protein [Hyphomicrobiaceae bacterium]
MKSFEVRTPVLCEAVEALRAVIAGRQDGSMEGTQARDIVAAANGLIRAVGQDLRVRLAEPRLAAQEAKLIASERARGERGAGRALGLTAQDNPRIGGE